MIMNISVVTTFNLSGHKLYGKKMIQSFLDHWPRSVKLHVFAEGFVIPSEKHLEVLDLHEACPELVAFKQRWSSVPWACGDISDHPVLRHRRDQKKNFKWDAVRFSNKVYAMHKCSEITDSDYLLWMDGDMVCHSDITEAELEALLPSSADICFLGRGQNYTECGLYGLNLKSPATREFLDEFRKQYDQAETGIFTLPEWHDSFVFDHVRGKIKLREYNWSRDVGLYTGHPLINSAWGAYLDHLKGDRKHQGRSSDLDLRTARSESYWKSR
jgi:hypothetical protein